MIIDILIVAAAYLLGSIPSAVWIGKAIHGIDVREHGSKNAGTNNTMRVLGVATGIPVLLIDVFKGFAAVKLGLLSPDFTTPTALVNFQLVLATAAVAGHIFPIFAGFRGGKGVATAVGILLALDWPATTVSICVFFITLFILRYVSVSSLMMGIAFPLCINFIFPTETLSLRIFSVVVCLLLFITHRANIRRLIRGEEKKADYLFGKRRL